MKKVSIIITSYLEQSKPYLDLCVRSVKNLSQFRGEIIIVSPKWYTPQYEGVRTVHPDADSYNNSHALNVGQQAASLDSAYYLFLNDDCIVHENMLNELLAASEMLQDQAVIMPVGNDMQAKYWLPIPYFQGPYRLEQIRGHESNMMNVPWSHQGLMFFDSLCLYCMLIPKMVFGFVGLFDSSLRCGDDTDYTKRVRLKGGLNAIAMNALCWHAGGASADITYGALDSEERQKDMAAYEAKWGEKPKWSNL